MQAKTTESRGAPVDKSALEGLTVLDFSHVLSGPYCTLLLSDYGATVYKIEPVDGGEAGRGWGPPFVGGQAFFFLWINRGKFGVSIDLKTPEGISLCRDMIDKVDVVIENFRPGTMERLGLGYEDLAATNPQLIYCSISGYGRTGPLREGPAMDLIVQCASGLLDITGTPDGERVRSGYSVTDITAGLFAVIGILMAVRHRDNTGRGQLVDISMYDAILSAMSSNLMGYLGSGQVSKPMGTGFPNIVPYRVYQAADRGISIAIGTEKLWHTFCKTIDREDLTSDVRFATNAQRVTKREELDIILSAIFSQRTGDDWKTILQADGIPCSTVATFPEVVSGPQAMCRNMFPMIDHPTAGKHCVTGPPIKLSDSPGQVGISAPLLGQHTRQALRSLLAMDDDEIDTLVERRVLSEPASARNE